MKIRDNVKPTIPPLPGGNYLGILVYSIAVGEQLCEFKDKGKRYNNQVVWGFEICGKTVEIDGKAEPRVLSKTFNIAKSSNSGLRKFISAWEAREFSDDEFLDIDTNDYVGKPALLTVVLNDTGEYSNIGNISPLPDGIPIQVPNPISPLIRFDMEPWSQAAFDSLPEWARNKIEKSTDYQKNHASTETISVKPGTDTMAALAAFMTNGAGGQTNTVQPTPNAAQNAMANLVAGGKGACPI